MYEYIESVGILFQLAGIIWGIITAVRIYRRIKKVGGITWKGSNGLDSTIQRMAKPAIGSSCALIFGTLILLINSLPFI